MPDANISNILAAAAVVGALVFLGRMVLSTIRIAAKVDEMLPVMLAMAKQFRTDSGSSLKDQINSLEKSAKESKEAANLAAQAAYTAQQTLDRLLVQQAVWLDATRTAATIVIPPTTPKLS